MWHAHLARGITGGTPVPLPAMRFSRNQIIGALIFLVAIWLVIVIRLIIARG